MKNRSLHIPQTNQTTKPLEIMLNSKKRNQARKQHITQQVNTILDYIPYDMYTQISNLAKTVASTNLTKQLNFLKKIHTMAQQHPQTKFFVWAEDLEHNAKKITNKPDDNYEKIIQKHKEEGKLNIIDSLFPTLLKQKNILTYGNNALTENMYLYGGFGVVIERLTINKYEGFISITKNKLPHPDPIWNKARWRDIYDGDANSQHQALYNLFEMNPSIAISGKKYFASNAHQLNSKKTTFFEKKILEGKYISSPKPRTEISTKRLKKVQQNSREYTTNKELCEGTLIISLH